MGVVSCVMLWLFFMQDRKDKKSRRASKSGAAAAVPADGAAENGSAGDGSGSAASPVVADDNSNNKTSDHDSYGDASFASAEGGSAATASNPGEKVKSPTSDADADADAATSQTNKADKKVQDVLRVRACMWWLECVSIEFTLGSLRRHRSRMILSPPPST